MLFKRPNSLAAILVARQTHTIPDALYGIEYTIDGDAGYRFWALECENTTPKRRSSARNSSIARKHAAYNVLLRSHAYRDHWGIPNLKLHLVMPSMAVDEKQRPSMLMQQPQKRSGH